MKAATCLQCGSSFGATRATARYCKPACRQAHHHAKPNVTNARPNATLPPIADDSAARLALVEAEASALRAELAELRRQLKVVTKETTLLLRRWAYRNNASFEQVESELRELAQIAP